MPQTVEVRFKGTRRDFFRWPEDDAPLRPSEAVIVQAERGQDFGRVHTAGAAAEKKCGTSCGGCERGTAEKTPLVASGDDTGEPAIDAAPFRAPEAADAGDASAPDPAPLPEPAEAEPAEAEPPANERRGGTPSLRSVVRRATAEEVRAAEELRRQEEEARRQVMAKARHHKLDMKVCDTEWQWDRSKLTVFFTAEKRVDFRALVRELASQFRTRIELRQIGVRDEAARLGGVGRCGREYCCSTWLGELTPVSLALAKDQHLSLNPTQISGGCGRLLCCLKYEHEFYVAARKRFPREGKAVATARGREKVIAVDIFRERVFLRHDEHGSRIIPLVDLRAEMEDAPSLEALAAQAPPPPRRGTEERRGPGPRGPRPEAPARKEPAGPPASRRDRRPPRPEPRAEVPAPPAPPSPPATDAPVPAEGQARRPRRRRRNRRRGKGPGGPSGPPSTPEA